MTSRFYTIERLRCDQLSCQHANFDATAHRASGQRQHHDTAKGADERSRYRGVRRGVCFFEPGFDLVSCGATFFTWHICPSTFLWSYRSHCPGAGGIIHNVISSHTAIGRRDYIQEPILEWTSRVGGSPQHRVRSQERSDLERKQEFLAGLGIRSR